jgi:hypothetical protein
MRSTIVAADGWRGINLQDHECGDLTGYYLTPQGGAGGTLPAGGQNEEAPTSYERAPASHSISPSALHLPTSSRILHLLPKKLP